MQVVVFKMNKYILIMAYGPIGGVIGEEVGTQCLKLNPQTLLFGDSFLVVLIPLAASFVPFVVITAILICRVQGYASYLKGLLFSFAYYLPFQYKAIWGNYKQPNIELSETFTSRVLVTVAGSLLLSLAYYAAIKYNDKKRKEHNKPIQSDTD